MIRHMKAALIAMLIPAAIVLLAFSQDDTTSVNPAVPAVDYPIILVHGLGGGPGDATFGKLEEYLENFYFNVEVMDFNNFNGKNYAKGKDAPTLNAMASALGNFVQDVMKEHKAEKVSFVAHSMGGLVVAAYINNFGEVLDKKKGAYDNNVHKVYYAQVPFYGTQLDEETLREYIEATDYGNYKDADAWVEMLQVGSDTLYNLDLATRNSNIYAVVDALTMMTGDDEVVTGMSGYQTSTLDLFRPFKRYRLLPKYAHSVLNKTDSSRGSFTFVEDFTRRNFVSISSFMDNGFTWRKFGPVDLSKSAMLMVRFVDDGTVNKVGEKDVLLKKLGGGSAPAAKNIKGILNESSRVFTFFDLEAGTYRIKVKGNKRLNEELTLDGTAQVNMEYLPKENELNLAGSDAIFSLPSLTLVKKSAPTSTYDLPALNDDGFEVEMTAGNASIFDFDKGLLFAIYNSKGNMNNLDSNGGRVQVVIRGREGRHDHEATVVATMDANKNRTRDGSDETIDFDTNTGGAFNWSQTHTILLTVRKFSPGLTQIKLEIDGRLVMEKKLKRYFNDSPVIHFGGDAGFREYQAMGGVKISNIAVRNLTN